MNSLQKKILGLADTQDVGARTYYSIAKELKVDHPYKVKYAIDQLIKNGNLLNNRKTGSIIKVTERKNSDGFLSIPIYGEASCGPPVAYADDTIKDFLKVSPSSLKTKKLKKIFALKAKGESMNQANIGGSSIEDGDYVVVESSDWPDFTNGDYIVSIIGGMANIKRYMQDEANQRILLLSESYGESAPIVIGREDLDNYKIAGKVVEVVKAP